MSATQTIGFRSYGGVSILPATQPISIRTYVPFKLALTISVAAVYCQLMQLMEIKFLVVLNNVVYWSGTLAYYVGRRLHSDRADKSGG